MCERAMCGRYNSGNMTCMLCNQIREHAISLMLYKGSGSIAAAAGAAMVVRKCLARPNADLSTFTVFHRYVDLYTLHEIYCKNDGSSRALQRRQSCYVRICAI